MHQNKYNYSGLVVSGATQSPFSAAHLYVVVIAKNIRFCSPLLFILLLAQKGGYIRWRLKLVPGNYTYIQVLYLYNSDTLVNCDNLWRGYAYRSKTKEN